MRVPTLLLLVVSCPISFGTRQKDDSVGCEDLYSDWLAQGFISCADFGTPAYNHVCSQLPEAEANCCACGGGVKLPSPSPGSTPVPVLTAAEINNFTEVMTAVLYHRGGCKNTQGCSRFFVPMLSAMHSYGLDLTLSRKAAFIGTVLHETDLFRTFIQPLDNGAGSVHLIPPNQVIACEDIPLMSLLLAATVCPNATNPCTCSATGLVDLVASSRFSFETGAWYFSRGSQLILGPSHGCYNMIAAADQGLGSVNPSCVTQAASPLYPSTCSLTGFHFVSYCVFGSLNDQGLNQRIDYYLVAATVLKRAQLGLSLLSPLTSAEMYGADGAGGDTTGGGGGGSGGVDSAVIFGVIIGAVAGLVCLFCCGIHATRWLSQQRGGPAAKPQRPRPASAPTPRSAVVAEAPAKPPRPPHRQRTLPQQFRESLMSVEAAVRHLAKPKRSRPKPPPQGETRHPRPAPQEVALADLKRPPKAHPNPPVRREEDSDGEMYYV